MPPPSRTFVAVVPKNTHGTTRLSGLGLRPPGQWWCGRGSPGEQGSVAFVVGSGPAFCATSVGQPVFNLQSSRILTLVRYCRPSSQSQDPFPPPDRTSLLPPWPPRDVLADRRQQQRCVRASLSRVSGDRPRQPPSVVTVSAGPPSVSGRVPAGQTARSPICGPSRPSFWSLVTGRKRSDHFVRHH